MTGIKLNITEDGEVTVDDREPMQECLAGVMCARCERSPEGAPMTIKCNAVKPGQNTYVFGFDKCPIGKWAKYLDVRSPDYLEKLHVDTSHCRNCQSDNLWRLKDNPERKIKNSDWVCWHCHPPGMLEELIETKIIGENNDTV